MHKLLILLVLLFCTFNFGIGPANAQLDLEAWCDEQEQTWNARTCYVKSGTISGILVISPGDTLEILDNGTLIDGRIISNDGRIRNYGTITITTRGGIDTNYGGSFLNAGIIFNNGAIFNEGWFSNHGTIYNNGDINNAEQFENAGVIYGNLCLLSHIYGDPFYPTGDIIKLDECSYLPSLAR